MYYHDLASYIDAGSEAKTFQITVSFTDGSMIASSLIPYADETLTKVNEDIAYFLAGEGPFAIWDKDHKALYHVYLRDVRKIGIKFIS